MTAATLDAPAAPADGASPDSLMRFVRGHAGVYEIIAAETYHALDAASASRLNKLRRSPLHCRYAIDHPDDDETDAKSLGTAGHFCLLEPTEFSKHYALGPDVDLRSKGGKAEWESFVGDNPGRTCLRGKEGQKLVAMHRAVWAHPAASRYLSEAGRHELSLLWNDYGTGVLCKARLDRLVVRGGAIIDIKTTRDASKEAFARSVHAYGYHRQGAFYLQGAQELKLTARAFCIVAVENEPPHAVGVYLLDDAAIAQGERELRPLLDRWAECVRSGVWGGYAEDAEILNLLPYHRDEEAGF